MKKFGIVYVFHGDKFPNRFSQIQEFVKKLRQNFTNTPQKLVILGSSNYPIEKQIKELYDEGCNNIIVVPVLLFSAIHLERDIKAPVKMLSNQLGFNYQVTSPLATQPSVIDYFKKAIRTVIDQQSLVTPLNVLVIAHGSKHSSTPQSALLKIKKELQTLDLNVDLGVNHGEPDFQKRLNLINPINPLLIVPYFLGDGSNSKGVCDSIIVQRSKRGGGATYMTDPLEFDDSLVPTIHCIVTEAINCIN